MATTKNIEVEKIVKISGIQLDLTMEEAMALRIVLSKVGGYQTSRRKLIDGILDSMVGHVDLEEWSDKRDLIVKDNCLWFKSPSEME